MSMRPKNKWVSTRRKVNVGCVAIVLVLIAASAIPASQNKAPQQTIKTEGALDGLEEANITREDLKEKLDAADLDRRIRVIHKIITVLFRLKTNLFYFDEPGSPSAYATQALISDDFPSGSVLLGEKLIEQVGKINDENELVLNSIMAHELAHLLQLSNHSTLKQKLLELHADYLAGWYLGNYLERSNKDDKAFQNEVKKVLEDFFARGDFEYNNPKHHGTPLERMGAVLAGVVLKETNPDVAYNKGVAYIENSTRGSKENKGSAELLETKAALRKLLADTSDVYSIPELDEVKQLAERIDDVKARDTFTSASSDGCTLWIRYLNPAAFDAVTRIPLQDMETFDHNIPGLTNPGGPRTVRYTIGAVMLATRDSKKSILQFDNLGVVSRHAQAGLSVQSGDEALAAKIAGLITKAIILCKDK